MAIVGVAVAAIVLTATPLLRPAPTAVETVRTAALPGVPVVVGSSVDITQGYFDASLGQAIAPR